MGVHYLEIGQQSTNDGVARDANQGHTVASVAYCFCLERDASFKDPMLHTVALTSL